MFPSFLSPPAFSGVNDPPGAGEKKFRASGSFPCCRFGPFGPAEIGPRDYSAALRQAAGSGPPRGTTQGCHPSQAGSLGRTSWGPADGSATPGGKSRAAPR